MTQLASEEVRQMLPVRLPLEMLAIKLAKKNINARFSNSWPLKGFAAWLLPFAERNSGGQINFKDE